MSSSDYNGSLFPACGPDQQQSATFLRMTTVIYVVLFLLGTIGNILVIVVIIKHREMRSSTNYFLINLSVADLLVLLICMPVGFSDIYLLPYFPFGKAMCYVVQLSDYLAPQASTLTLIAIAAERYFAICTPFKAQYMFTARRTLFVSISTWIISLVTLIPSMHTIVYSECLSSDGEIKPTCSAFAHTDAEKMYILIVTVVFFAVPCVVLTGVYFVIGRTLRNHDMLMASVSHSPPSRTSSDAADAEDDLRPPNDSKWTKLLSCVPCFKAKSRHGGNAFYLKMPSHSKRKLERFNSANGSVYSDVSGTDCEFIEITTNPRISIRKSSDASERSNLREQSRDLPPIKEEDGEYLHIHQQTRNTTGLDRASVQTIRTLSPSSIHTSTTRPYVRRRSHGKLTFMLGTVVVVFFVCYLPMRVFALWQIFVSQESFERVNIDMLMFFVLLARILVYINSAINPLLYNLISSKFRNAFRSTVSCREMPNSKPLTSKAPSSTSLRQTLRGK